MLDRLQTMFSRTTDTTIVHECRTCGETLDQPRSQCPTCGSDEIASYEL